MELFAYSFTINERYQTEITIATDMRHAMAQINQLYPDSDITRIIKGDRVKQPQKFVIEATTATRLIQG